MRLTRRTTLALSLPVAAVLPLVAAPAQAATGQVVVFSTEAQPLTIFKDPTGCHKLPPLAHVLANLTDGPIRVFADPACLIPGTLPISGLGVLPAGYGTHVTGVGSFSG